MRFWCAVALARKFVPFQSRVAFRAVCVCVRLLVLVLGLPKLGAAPPTHFPRGRQPRSHSHSTHGHHQPQPNPPEAAVDPRWPDDKAASNAIPDLACYLSMAYLCERSDRNRESERGQEKKKTPIFGPTPTTTASSTTK